jgi:hypothetical protein
MLMRRVQENSGLTQSFFCASLCGAGLGWVTGCVCRASTRAFDLRSQVSGGEGKTKWVVEVMRGWCIGGL